MPRTTRGWLPSVWGGVLAWPLTLLSWVFGGLYRSAYGARKNGSKRGINSFHRLRSRLGVAKTFDEYHRICVELDWLIEDNTKWKQDMRSIHYDWRLIYHQLKVLREIRVEGDIHAMMYTIRTAGLIRNLGGITDSKLYRKTYAGTKDLIELYTTEVVRVLSQIASAPTSSTLTTHSKLSFFNDVRQAYGMSALLLQGGATFGLFHLGVVKSLFDQELLPRIISGSAVGALIAALVCIHDDQELAKIFETHGINLEAFAKASTQGRRRRKIVRFLKYGYILDVKVLEDCVRANVGDLTFEEAFNLSNRVLNITVSSSRANEMPKLLNYLTAPNVLIWSAACASTSATYPLYSQVDLLAKDVNGTVKRWVPRDEIGEAVTWHEASHRSRDSPNNRLSELFNVNHFIVSQAGGTVAPFLLKSVKNQSNLFVRVYNMLEIELLYRAKQLYTFGLWPSFLHWVVDEPFTGDVTIAPSLALSDYKKAFTNPTASEIGMWIRGGERATWKWMSLIRNRCWAECVLDRSYVMLKQNIASNTRALTGTAQYYPIIHLEDSADCRKGRPPPPGPMQRSRRLSSLTTPSLDADS